MFLLLRVLLSFNVSLSEYMFRTEKVLIFSGGGTESRFVCLTTFVPSQSMF
jgi:hypothetical protein